MHSVPFSQARSQFTEIANQVQYQHETWVFTKNNRPTVAMIPIAALKILQEAIEEQEDADDLKTLLARQKDASRPLEDVLKESRIAVKPTAKKSRLVKLRRCN